MATLKAGAAKADITPKESLLPIPFFMQYAFKEVQDKIYVRALFLESDEKVLFVTFDCTMIPNPFETLKYICEISHLDENHVFMCATHTHCAPIVGVLDEKTPADDKKALWYADVKAAIKEAVEGAERSKQPAKFGFGKGKSYININRDGMNDDGTSSIGVNFGRASDKTLNVLKFENYEGKPIAFLTNYAVHATVMNGCIVNGGIRISGDIAGATSAIIEEAYPSSICLWTSGAAGDQNPRVGTQFTFDKSKGVDGVKNLGETGHIILEYLAKEHSLDIMKTAEKIECAESELSLSAQKTKVSCAGRNPDNLIAFAKMQGIELPPPKDVEYALRLVTIGDVAIQGISAEVVTSIGAAATSVSDYKNTILITQADYYTGYVPDDWEYDHKAFEAEGTPVKQGAAEPAFKNGFKELYGYLKK